MALESPPARPLPAAELIAASTAAANSPKEISPSAAARASDRVKLAPALSNAPSIDAAARSAGSLRPSSAAAASTARRGTASTPPCSISSVIRPDLRHSLELAPPDRRAGHWRVHQHPPFFQRQ